MTSLHSAAAVAFRLFRAFGADDWVGTFSLFNNGNLFLFFDRRVGGDAVLHH
jgi:hypothetical protein